MLDTSKQIVATLKTILPTYYELIETEYQMPCITYQKYDDSQQELGSSLSYSSVAYYIKLWGKDLKTLTPYMLQIDSKMRGIGYKRESYNELSMGNELCIITQYRGLGKEEL